MTDTETPPVVDAGFGMTTGIVDMPNGERWVRMTMESGLIGIKVDVPPHEAVNLAQRIPEMLLQAVDTIHHLIQEDNDHGDVQQADHSDHGGEENAGSEDHLAESVSGQG